MNNLEQSPTLLCVESVIYNLRYKKFEKNPNKGDTSSFEGTNPK